MAPPKWRGRLNTVVQCGTITGIVVGSAINIGAYQTGGNRTIDLAIARRDEINGFLRQAQDEAASFPNSIERLLNIKTQ